ncbi:MAG: hypothetical protein WC634_04895 [archaeon]
MAGSGKLFGKVSRFHFVSSKASPLDNLHKARTALDAVLKSGAKGRARRFALLTLQERAFSSESPDPDIITFITAARRAAIMEARIPGARKSPSVPQEEMAAVDLKRLPEKISQLFPKIRQAMSTVDFFSRETDIRARHEAFGNLIKLIATRDECETVASWLVERGGNFESLLGKERGYLMYTNYADLALRCYGAASNLYSRFHLEQQAVALQKKLYSLNQMFGLV